MKLAVVAPSPVPFVLGGAERAYQGLVDAVNRSTAHDAELLKLPVRESTLPDLVAGYQAFTSLDVGHFDLVVSSKYPAWMVRHPNHTIYVFHRLRGLYDTYALFGLPRQAPAYREAPLVRLQSLLADTPRRTALDEVLHRFREAVDACGPEHPAFALPGPFARALVHWLDGAAFAPGEARRYVALSRTVAAREGYFPAGCRVDVAYLPAGFPERAPSEGEGFFTASRLDGPKRIDLLIRAMRHVRADVPLRIAGTGPELDALQELADDDPRITFLGHLSDEQLQDEYARALAVPFVPYAEDYGLITLEAQRCGTPVVTCTDAGGPTELVVHERTGLVVEPRPEALGAALDRLAADPGLAHALGVAGQEASRSITWERVIETLTGEGERPRRRSDLPKVVVTSTFAVHPARGGGQLRCRELYGALTDRFDVEVVSLTPYGSQPLTQTVDTGFVERQVPRSRAHALEELERDRAAGIPVGDIVAATDIARTPAYVTALREAAADADLVLLAHPFLEPAVRAAGVGLPVVYDAHNLEVDLKVVMLPEGPARTGLLAATEAVERAAATGAALVVACAPEDARGMSERYGVAPERIIEIPNGSPVARTRFVGGADRAANGARFIARLLEEAPARAGVEHLAAFVASWHQPNIDAAAELLALAPSMPDVLFVLAGGHSKAFVRDVPPNVVPLGIVSEATLDGLLRSVSVALNPMGSGGGSNLKIVEYLAHGAPVVTTPLGVRGYDLRDGEHVVVAPLEGFADGIRRVLDDPAGSSARALRAREQVAGRYDWGLLGRRLGDRLGDLVPAAAGR
jgi:glycosyltransferase involved in cell wall biosynthesis